MNMKKILVLIMSLAMIVSACAPAIHAFDGVIDGEHNHGTANENKHYVSIGDSMTNGYGFDGYAQGTDAHDFLNGVGTYGEGSYALQFAKYLESLGYDVDHTKLGVSALRAEDLLYILGGCDAPADDWFEEVLDYSGATYEELAAHYQNAVKDADIITLGVGNASFGAFMLSRVTSTIGIMGGAPNVNPEYTLENALKLVDNEEAKTLVINVYNKFYDSLTAYLPESAVEMYNIEAVCDVVAYTVAGFVVNYAKSVDKIVELNEKENLEIILLGLMNTTYGMEVRVDENTVIPFGTLMDEAFGLLNTYMAAYPTAKQLAGGFEGVKFYYADNEQPLFIVNVLDDLAEAGWTNIDNGRLSADIIRSRTIRTYNGTLRAMIGAAFAQGVNAVIPDMVRAAVVQGYRDALASDQAELLEMLGVDVYALTEDELLDLLDTFGILAQFEKDLADNINAMLIDDPYSFLPEITLEDVQAYSGEAWTNAAFFANDADRTTLSVAVYLAIEDAIVKSVDVNEFSLEGLAQIAGDLSGLFADFAPDTTSPDAVRATLGEFMTSETLLPLVKIYAIFNIGDGMCVHPTPAGHDDLYKAIVESYEEGWTAKNETVESLTEFVTNHYDEAFGVAYLFADKEGYIDLTVDGIDKVINRLENVDLSDNTMSSEFRVELQNELDATISTLKEIRALLLIDATEDVPALMAALRGLKDDLNTHITNLRTLAEQFGIDILVHIIIPALVKVAQLLDKYIEIIVDRIAAYLGAFLDQYGDEIRQLVEVVIKVTLLVGAAIKDIVKVVLFVYDLLILVFGNVHNALIVASKIAILVINYIKNNPDIINKGLDLLRQICAVIIETYGETHSVMATAKVIYRYALRVVAGINNKFEDSIHNATNGDYVITEDSFYLALGSNAAYVEELAGMLFLGDKNAHLGLDEDYRDALAKADLVTIKFNNGEVQEFAKQQAIGALATIIRNNETLMSYYNMYQEDIDAMLAEYGFDMNAQVVNVDWTKYLDAETYAILVERFAVLKEMLVEYGIPAVYELDLTPMLQEYLPGTDVERVVVEIPAAAIVAYAIENAVYSYVETLARVKTTLETVYAVAPNATVVITGINNPVNDYAALIALVAPEALEYLDTLNDVVEILNAPLYACAVVREKTIFVLSEDANDIYEALHAVCAHAYDDECEDTTCNICGEVRVAPGHNFGNYVSNNDATCEENGTKTGTCSKCGKENTITDKNSALGHDYEWKVVKEPTDEVEGKEQQICKRCGKVGLERPIAMLPGSPVMRIVGIIIGSIAAACGIGSLAYWFFVKRKEGLNVQ